MRNALAGVAAGLAATVPMTMVMETLHERLDGEVPRPLPPREIAEALAVKFGVHGDLSERDMQNLALALHVGYAALTGAIFSAVAPRRTTTSAAAGALFGFGVWATSYLGWLPVSGVRQPITYDPVARTGLMIAAHLAWGAAAGAIFAAMASRKRT
jgi:uncharacterized membrane protein YagU involved in acid resistance